MPFYERLKVNYEYSLLDNKDKFKLGGTKFKNLYFEKNPENNPEDSGWDASSNDITKDGSSLIIDFFPQRQLKPGHSGIFELEHLYVYTYKDKENNKVTWSVLLLKLNELFLKMDPNINNIDRNKFLQHFFIESEEKSKLAFEFLYIHGEDKHWNWGLIGRVNSAIIYKEPLTYFLKFLRDY